MTDKAERMANDPYFKIDHEGPRVLVSFAWTSLSSRSLPKFLNVIVHTGMPRTNEELDLVKLAAMNWVRETSQYVYNGEISDDLLECIFILDIKEV